MNNGDAILQACRAGHGVALMPTFIVWEALAAGEVERLLPGWEDGVAGAIYAVFPASRNLSPKVRAFVDFLARRFAPQPYWDG
jgi:DNA-binding transcriptional LysR family regulator